MKNFITLLISVFIFSCSSKTERVPLVDKILDSDPREIIIDGNPSIRGLDVFDSETVWLSGSNGTFSVSTNQGETWKTGKIGEDTLLDFRDIVAFGKESAIAISAGSPAKIYKTNDQGETWNLTYENKHPGIFFNSFEFWDENNGIACADPLEGGFFFLLTHDGGNTWEQIPPGKLPKPLNQEGGFAASGTCIALSDNGTAMIGTGGNQARVILTHNFGKSWQAIKTPIKGGSPTHGIYSLHWARDKSFFITGGNYMEPDSADSNFAITNNGGLTWELTESMPHGYRSCVKSFNKNLVIVCGKGGVDISYDLGKSWTNKKLIGYYTFDISNDNRFAIFAGANGKVGIYKMK